MGIFRVSGQFNVNLEAIGQGFPERLVPGTKYIVGNLDSINNNTEYIGGRASWKTFFFENKELCRCKVFSHHNTCFSPVPCIDATFN